MAAKKESAPLRGAKLLKKAIETAKASGIIASPDPLAASAVRKMRLPDGETVSPGLKEFLLFDAGFLGIDYDEDEGDIEAVSLEEIVEENFGEEAVPAFGEAYELLSGDCVPFALEADRPSFLYVGTPDDAGEYPVLSVAWEEGVARVGGFVPFDVWAAQELGAIERGADIGQVPAEYAETCKVLAERNGDGRVLFTPKAGEAAAKDDQEESEEG